MSFNPSWYHYRRIILVLECTFSLYLSVSLPLSLCHSPVVVAVVGSFTESFHTPSIAPSFSPLHE